MACDCAAACAQIEKIDSVYAWKGKIESGKEYHVLFKTVEARYEAVERAIRAIRGVDRGEQRLTPSLTLPLRGRAGWG